MNTITIIQRTARCWAALFAVAFTATHSPSFAAETSPDAEARTAVTILIKNTLIAVNQGNLTGNYTVLRDLASPTFREKNDPAELARIFEVIRKQKIDLSPIVQLEPVLMKPKFVENNQMYLKGYFASQPVRINFELLFQKADSGGWMINGISVGTENAAAPSGSATQTPVTQDKSQKSRVTPAEAEEVEDPKTKSGKTAVTPTSGRRPVTK